MTSSRRLAPLLALAFAAGLAVLPGAPSPARADGERETPRYDLSPTYKAGDRYRVVRDYKQRTYTAIPDSPRRPGPNVNPSDYDAKVHVDATVTVEKAAADGDAEVWTATFEEFRYDLPDPLQSKEYRDRRRERKAKNLPEDSHPLEGETVKVDRSGPKTRIFKVLKSGEDAGISQRYPEVLPLLQDLVEPDWVPVDAVALGTEWEMNADHVFRFTRVLLRSPLKGVIKCRLAGVAQSKATVEFTAHLTETYAKVTMRIEVRGTIGFDLGAHRPISTDYKGEVQISSEGSALSGRGGVEGSVHVLPALSSAAAGAGGK